MEEQNDYENIIETDENITVSGEITGTSPLDQKITVDQQEVEIAAVSQNEKCCKSNHIALWLAILIATNAVTASVVASHYQRKAGVTDAKEPVAVQEEKTAQPSAPAVEKIADAQAAKVETAALAVEQKKTVQPDAVAIPQKVEDAAKPEKVQKNEVAEPVAATEKKDEKKVQDQNVKPAAAPVVQEKKISLKDVSPRLLKSGKSRFILIHADYIPQICEQVKDAKFVLDVMEACLDLQNKIENSGTLLANDSIQIGKQSVVIKEIKNGILTCNAGKAVQSMPLADLAMKYATTYEYIAAETARKDKKRDLLPAYFVLGGDCDAANQYAKRISAKAAKKAKKLQAELPVIVKIAYTCTKDEQTKKELQSKFAKVAPDAFK